MSQMSSYRDKFVLYRLHHGIARRFTGLLILRTDPPQNDSGQLRC